MQFIYNLIQPIRYKIKFYQVALLLYIDQVLMLLNTKYDFLKEKLVEQRIKLKVLQFEQYQIRSEFYESLRLVKKFKLNGIRILIF